MNIRSTTPPSTTPAAPLRDDAAAHAAQAAALAGAAAISPEAAMMLTSLQHLALLPKRSPPVRTTLSPNSLQFRDHRVMSVATTARTTTLLARQCVQVRRSTPPSNYSVSEGWLS